MTLEAKEYTKSDLNLAKAKLCIFETEMGNMDNKSVEVLRDYATLLHEVSHIKKMRIKQSKRRYDNSEEGRNKNRARSLRNYYKKKAKKEKN